MNTKQVIAIGCMLAGVVWSGEGDTNRPASWAQPVVLDGVPNLHQVTTNLYRSAQPTAQGMQNLRKKGIVTVVNLRSFHSDRDEIAETGLGYEHIYMKAWHPERKEIVRFLQLVTDPGRTPVLVHCQHGADRTGTMCALYRIAVQGWTKEDAIREMTEGGYGFHEVWRNLPSWIAELDIESIKKDAGIGGSATSKSPYHHDKSDEQWRQATIYTWNGGQLSGDVRWNPKDADWWPNGYEVRSRHGTPQIRQFIKEKDVARILHADGYVWKDYRKSPTQQ